MTARDDELLRPTLAPDLDVRGFKPLFRPQSILWPTFFGGPIAGAILFGMNYARMQRPEFAKRVWIGGVVVGVALAAAIGWYFGDLTATAGVERNSRSSTRVTRYLVAGISVGIGWLIAKHQHPRFTAWESVSNSPASLWVPGFLAWLAGAVVMFGVIAGVIALRVNSG